MHAMHTNTTRSSGTHTAVRMVFFPTDNVSHRSTPGIYNQEIRAVLKPQAGQKA